jgi:hypothetical protein
VGWHEKEDYTAAGFYREGSPYVPAGNIILYAQWRDYIVGDTGPKGGIIFYDKGSVSDGGWRYLEAAHEDLRVSRDETVSVNGTPEQYFKAHPDLFFFLRQNNDGGDGPYDENDLYFDIRTDTDIGTGKDNTDLLNGDRDSGWDPETGSAAYYVDHPDDEWFLPSRDELKALYEVVESRGHDGFTPMSGVYWSSSQCNESKGVPPSHDQFKNQYCEAWALLFGAWDDSTWVVDFIGSVFQDGWYYDTIGKKADPTQGVSFPHIKNALHKVRPVRRF